MLKDIIRAVDDKWYLTESIGKKRNYHPQPFCIIKKGIQYLTKSLLIV